MLSCQASETDGALFFFKPFSCQGLTTRHSTVQWITKYMKWYFWAYSDFRDAILIKLKGKSWWVLDTEAAWFINSIPTYTYFMTCSKKNIIIRNYAYLWKYVTKIVNSLTLSQLDSGWWSSARKCKEWKWGRWKGAWETSIRFQLNEKHITNAQQSTTCLFSDLVELNLYFCKIGSIKNS